MAEEVSDDRDWRLRSAAGAAADEPAKKAPAAKAEGAKEATGPRQSVKQDAPTKPREAQPQQQKAEKPAAREGAPDQVRRGPRPAPRGPP